MLLGVEEYLKEECVLESEPLLIYQNAKHAILMVSYEHDGSKEDFFVIEMEEGQELYNGTLTECMNHLRELYAGN